MGEFGGFGGLKILESKSIFKNLQAITAATLTLPTNQTGSFGIALSADGGTTWEGATNATEHTFVVTGNDLRYRIIGEGVINIQDSSGVESPIKVTYKTA